MRTVVLFRQNPKGNSFRNALYTRTLRKVGIIGVQYVDDDDSEVRKVSPRNREHWLVEIVRENLAPSGNGCFILKPLEQVDPKTFAPLVHGMYEMSVDADALILTPQDQTKLWEFSQWARNSLLAETPGARSVVVNQGGPMWARRPPSDFVVSRAAKSLLRKMAESTREPPPQEAVASLPRK